MLWRLLRSLLLLPVLAAPISARAQMAGGPPSVGVTTVEPMPVTETSEFIGRIQAVDRVSLTARVIAFLEERRFVEGAEVNAGDLLFRLERTQYEADVEKQEAAVAESTARLTNANIQLQRAQSLLSTPAGQRAAVDDAIANQRAIAAQLMSAQAALKLAQLNLTYTEIRAPVAGKISRAAVTIGNVVGPTTGPLATIVSQDPMYVLFPVANRTLLELDKRLAETGGLRTAKVRLRLTDGTMYGPSGSIDYIDPSVATNTDTIIVRARVPNPPYRLVTPGEPVARRLIDGGYVTVLVEGAEPVMALSVPRAAVLSDQGGSYVYVVDKENKVEQRRIELGQSTPARAVISRGLKQGETIIVDGLQRARPGITVAPSPMAPQPAATNANAG
jgi:membrane fusion protein (multidrug efflux system)